MITAAADMAARIDIINDAAAGNWGETAEQLAALNADNLHKFYGELSALHHMAKAEIRARKGQ